MSDFLLLQATESLTSESGKIGKDGRKFLKKSTPTPARPVPVQSAEPPVKSVTQKAQSQTGKAEPQQKKGTFLRRKDIEDIQIFC